MWWVTSVFVNISLHFKCIPLISGTFGVQVLNEEDRSSSINWCCCSCLKRRYITDHWYLRVKSGNVCSRYLENLQWHVHRFERILFCLWFGNYVQHTCLFVFCCFFFWGGGLQKFDSLVWIKFKIFCRKVTFPALTSLSISLIWIWCLLYINMCWRGCSVNVLIPKKCWNWDKYF